MHDIKMIRENPEAFDAALARRGVAPAADELLSLDNERKELEGLHQFQVAARNKAAKEIGAAKAAGKIALFEQLVAMSQSDIGDAGIDASRVFAERLRIALSGIPNLSAADVPLGADEDDNVVVHTRGTFRNFPFTPREHFDIGPALGLDFETAQKVSGARFAYLRGGMARLSRALGQFMLDHHTAEYDYQEVAPPLLVRDEAFFGTGQLPKFAEDSFQTSLSNDRGFLRRSLELALIDRDPLADPFNTDTRSDVLDRALEGGVMAKADRRWLIPTAEVSLTNIVSGDILADAALPLRFTALTPCFRSEAGAAGKDTRGLIRQHQFDKVELVSITRPEDSEAEHERMTACAEDILDKLELPYRRMLLCTGDMGFSARKTFDLEVWLPGQGRYREISSCSNCGDFQARRMNARYRPEGEKGTRFVHTLNGSALAVGRALVAVIENYQEADGSVTVPAVLRPYMGGVERISPA